MHWVYIIQSLTSHRHYIGVTSNLEQRLRHHNSGANRSTKSDRPWKILYQEQFSDQNTAWKRER